jgi:pantoate kinase
MSDAVRAFVPGHVTGFFTVDRDEDPTKAGSRGAGLALSDGVTVTVDPVGDSGVVFDGDRVEMEPVERVLDALDVTAAVRGETDLPLGAGFGVSGAMALGTALAANAVRDRGLSAYELATVAHGAEVQAGTGLGDVVAQRHGGAPIRLEPGSPQHNKMDAVPAQTRIEYVTFGDLATDEVIGGDTDTLTAAGTRALSELVQEPTLDRFFRASRKFARESGLLTDRVHEAIADVADTGGDATMGMLGQTVVARGTGLTDAGYDPAACRIDPTGAALLSDGGERSLPL